MSLLVGDWFHVFNRYIDCEYMSCGCWCYIPSDCPGVSFVSVKPIPMSKLSGIVAGKFKNLSKIKLIIDYNRGETFCIYVKKVKLPL
jgi:hypothetical protein